MDYVDDDEHRQWRGGPIEPGSIHYADNLTDAEEAAWRRKMRQADEDEDDRVFSPVQGIIIGVAVGLAMWYVGIFSALEAWESYWP